MNSTSTSSRQQKCKPSRKKSCLQCAKSKVRCDLQRPACGRCVAAKNQCRYATSPQGPAPTTNVASRQSLPPVQNIATPLSLPNTSTDYTDPALEGSAIGGQSTVAHSTALQPTAQLPTSGNRGDALSLDFSNLDPVPLADADEIRIRWMRPFFAVGEQPLKTFHPFTLQYISCVLRTYPKHMIEDDGFPPIIHPMQVAEGNTAVPLANCYSLIRLWQHRAPGSEEIVAGTIRREMSRLEGLVSPHRSCDSGNGGKTSLRRADICLLGLECRTARYFGRLSSLPYLLDPGVLLAHSRRGPRLRWHNDDAPGDGFSRGAEWSGLPSRTQSFAARVGILGRRLGKTQNHFGLLPTEQRVQRRPQRPQLPRRGTKRDVRARRKMAVGSGDSP